MRRLLSPGPPSLPLRAPPLLEMALRPSCEKATHHTGPACPLYVRTSLPVPASHSLRVPSTLPDRTRRPSGENATVLTLPVCPSSFSSSRPLSTSHSRTVLSM